MKFFLNGNTILIFFFLENDSESHFQILCILLRDTEHAESENHLIDSFICKHAHSN